MTAREALFALAISTAYSAAGLSPISEIAQAKIAFSPRAFACSRSSSLSAPGLTKRSRGWSAAMSSRSLSPTVGGT